MDMSARRRNGGSAASRETQPDHRRHRSLSAAARRPRLRRHLGSGGARLPRLALHPPAALARPRYLDQELSRADAGALPQRPSRSRPSCSPCSAAWRSACSSPRIGGSSGWCGLGDRAAGDADGGDRAADRHLGRARPGVAGAAHPRLDRRLLPDAVERGGRHEIGRSWPQERLRPLPRVDLAAFLLSPASSGAALYRRGHAHLRGPFGDRRGWRNSSRAAARRPALPG